MDQLTEYKELEAVEQKIEEAEKRIMDLTLKAGRTPEETEALNLLKGQLAKLKKDKADWNRRLDVAQPQQQIRAPAATQAQAAASTRQGKQRSYDYNNLLGVAMDVDQQFSPMRAMALDATRFTSYNINGIDLKSFYLPRTQLVEMLFGILKANRFTLLSSPPASGKTSLLMLLRHHLSGVNFSFMSFLDNEKTAFELLKEVGVDLRSQTCSIGGDQLHVIMMDDAQGKYQESSFWSLLIKFGETWIPRNVKFVISATYSLASTGDSPVEFQSMNRISRNDLLLTPLEYQEFMSSPLGLRNIIKLPYVRRVIWEECGGLIGAVRRSTQAIQENFDKDPDASEEAILSFYLSQELAKQMERCFGAQHSSPGDINLKKCLEQCFLGKAGMMLNLDDNQSKYISRLRKSGILSETNFGCEIKFTSPLARRYYAQWLFPNRSLQIPENVLDLVKKAVGLMSASILQSSVASDRFPKEATFQHLLMVALANCTPPGCAICPELSEVFPDPQAPVGQVERISGEIDFYLDGDLRWGIELLARGGQIGEHIDRFSRDGKYHALKVADYIVVDFRPGPVSNVRRYEKRMTVFFSSDFSVCEYVYGTDTTVHEIHLRS